MRTVAQVTLDEWPRQFNLKIYRGDSFGEVWSITIPDLANRGGPSDLDEEGVEVVAQVRDKADDGAPSCVFDVEILDGPSRKVRPKLTKAQTGAMDSDGFWDIEVRKGEFARTILQGRVQLGKDKSR